MAFSMSGAIEDALRLSWAVRRKPLESFLLPAAAFSLPGGAGVLACRDGSLVSLFRLDGARSMMGAGNSTPSPSSGRAGSTASSPVPATPCTRCSSAPRTGRKSW